MIKGLIIEPCDLGYDEILPLLQRVDKEFDPPFFMDVDMKQYAQKLQQFGHFIIAKVEEDLAGLVVLYRNEEEKYVYIPLFVIIAKYAGRHIGQQVLDATIKYCNSTYAEIRLQVLKINLGAMAFYQKQGFIVTNEDADRYLMVKRI